ncbi:MAG: hypothetical protein MJ244_02600 [Clostridia bacterium]|nr:hypothetical protein [Clostridia bacterium]
MTKEERELFLLEYESLEARREEVLKEEAELKALEENEAVKRYKALSRRNQDSNTNYFKTSTLNDISDHAFRTVNVKEPQVFYFAGYGTSETHRHGRVPVSYFKSIDSTSELVKVYVFATDEFVDKHCVIDTVVPYEDVRARFVELLKKYDPDKAASILKMEFTKPNED